MSRISSTFTDENGILDSLFYLSVFTPWCFNGACIILVNIEGRTPSQGLWIWSNAVIS